MITDRPRATIAVFPLNIQINVESSVPYYRQIVDQIRALVKSNAVREGEEFFAEGEVAAALGVSKTSVHQAFLKLRSEGLLVIEKGRRPSIGSGRVPWNFQLMRGFAKEMKHRGLTPSAKLLSIVETRAKPQVAHALNLRADDSIFVLKRLRYVNSKPVALVTSFMASRLFPGLADQDLEKSSLYHLFEKVYGRKLNWAEEEIGAACATAEQAKLLEYERGMPLLQIRETTYDSRQMPIEHSHSWLRADRYTATVISVLTGPRKAADP
jgi:GntR family transcriptional regulator